jgi:hypothetical protein
MRGMVERAISQPHHNFSAQIEYPIVEFYQQSCNHPKGAPNSFELPKGQIYAFQGILSENQLERIFKV